MDIDESLNLSIYSSSTGSHLWGSFKFGNIKGFIRSVGSLPTAANTPVHFQWRARDEDHDLGDFLDDRVNRGFITFLGDGKISGHIEGSYYQAPGHDFTGEEVEQASKAGSRCVAHCKQKWRRFTAKAIRSRKRKGSDCEYAMESDTSYGETG